jgi:hypothetical protein
MHMCVSASYAGVLRAHDRPTPHPSSTSVTFPSFLLPHFLVGLCARTERDDIWSVRHVEWTAKAAAAVVVVVTTFQEPALSQKALSLQN